MFVRFFYYLYGRYHCTRRCDDRGLEKPTVRERARGRFEISKPLFARRSGFDSAAGVAARPIATPRGNRLHTLSAPDKRWRRPTARVTHALTLEPVHVQHHTIFRYEPSGPEGRLPVLRAGERVVHVHPAVLDVHRVRGRGSRDRAHHQRQQPRRSTVVWHHRRFYALTETSLESGKKKIKIKKYYTYYIKKKRRKKQHTITMDTQCPGCLPL